MRVAVGARDEVVYTRLLPPRPTPRPELDAWTFTPASRDVLQGAFVIDLIDTATAQVVWRGVARLDVEPDRVNIERLDRIVARIMNALPRRTSVGPPPP